MPHLLSLPNELLVNVVYQLPQRRRMRDLLNLLLVCRRLKHAVESALYRSIGWRWKDDTPAKRTRLHLLLRTLIVRPDLASSVQHVQFRGGLREAVWVEEASQNFNEQERIQVEKHILKLFDKPAVWLLGFEQGCLDALIAITITLLPKLWSLSLDFNASADEWRPEIVYSSDDEETQSEKTTPPKWQHRYLDELFTMLLCSSESPASLQFPHLRTVACGAVANENVWIDKPFMQVDVVLPLFYLPSLESINLSNVVAKHISWPRKPPQLELKTLLLRGMLDNALEELLTVVKPLKNLRYHFDCDASRSSDVNSRQFRPQALIDALMSNKDNLDTLEVVVDLWTSQSMEIGNRGPWGIEGITGSLKHFTRLTALTMPLIALVGWSPNTAIYLSDVVPEHLKILQLRDDMYHSVGWEWDEKHYFRTIAQYLQHVGKENLALRQLILSIEDYRWKTKDIRKFEALSTPTVACELKFKHKR